VNLNIFEFRQISILTGTVRFSRLGFGSDFDDRKKLYRAIFLSLGCLDCGL